MDIYFLASGLNTQIMSSKRGCRCGPPGTLRLGPAPSWLLPAEPEPEQGRPQRSRNVSPSVSPQARSRGSEQVCGPAAPVQVGCGRCGRSAG